MEINLEKNEESKTSNIVLSQTAVEILQKTSPWAKFISIIGLIFGSILVILAFYFLIAKNATPYYGSSMCITYLIIAFIFLRINLLLYNYSLEIKEINSVNSLENAFMMLHKYWKYIGIFFIVYLSFVLIALIISISI
jgi:hypothetical protein